MVGDDAERASELAADALPLGGPEPSLTSGDAVVASRAAEDPLIAEARGLLSEIEQELAAVSRALDRLESGRYGRCEICDAALGEDRLSEDPTADRCPAHG